MNTEHLCYEDVTETCKCCYHEGHELTAMNYAESHFVEGRVAEVQQHLPTADLLGSITEELSGAYAANVDLPSVTSRTIQYRSRDDYIPARATSMYYACI